MSWASSNIYICGTVKDCEKYLDNVFSNIKKITELFADYRIVIYFDVSKDGTLLKLVQHKKLLGDRLTIIVNREPMSPRRTENISKGRNSCLQNMRNTISNFLPCDYFIVIDMDNVCSGKMDLDVFKRAMDKSDQWDSISFNREGYYDIWALSIDKYIYSSWGWWSPYEVVDHMRNYIIDKLRKVPADKLVDCRSAFNGFAIYKVSKFLDCHYDWRMPKQYMDLEELKEQQRILWGVGSRSPLEQQTDEPDCEHRAFHMMATAKNGARIKITPEILF